MNIIVTAKMGTGTIQAKLEPISDIEGIGKIYFLRKKKGPQIAKVHYILLPRICNYALFNITITPLLLLYYVIKFKCSFIISYHIIPYAFFAAFASYFSGIPFFICQTGLLIQKQSQNPLFWFFLKRTIEMAQKLCVPGNFSYDFWISKGISDAKVIKLHSTVDTDKFAPHTVVEKKYDFIFVGRIAEEKRPEFLLKAFLYLLKNKRKKANLLMVGDGPLSSQTKEIVRSLNLERRVTFAGFQADVLPWLNKSRFLLLTSRTEGLPCAVMEGMSAGLVPITTSVGNLPDIVIDGETGFCVEKDDIQGFVEKMALTLDMDKDVLRQMQMNARSIIVNYHSHKISCLIWKKLILSKSSKGK